MTHGTGSTLVLHPDGQSDLTFNLSGALGSVTTCTYIVDLGRLDFNEEARWQWAYEQGPLGGRVVGNTAQLVPLRLALIIKAVSSDYRKEAYRVLQQAVMNRRGGTLEYLPEGAGASTLSTFYHYVASAPPRVLDDTRNRWDADPVDGWYTLQVEVDLQTQPLATSDPASLVAIASATLDNWYDTTAGQTNRLTVDADDLLGSFPALTRFFIAPASGQRLGRVTLFTRSAADGTLADLVTVYEAQDAAIIAPSVAWAEVVDATRGGGAYMRCLPNSDANNVAHGLSFTLLNPEAAHGRFAVFGVVYDDAYPAGVWTHQVKLVSGNIAQTGESDYYAATTQNWQLLFAGEFELPLTDLADVTAGYAAGPYLEWYSTRASGTSEFRLDGLALVWVSDALGPEGEGTALDVPCADGDVGYIQGGVVAPQQLFIENLLGVAGQIAERAYVVNGAGNLQRILSGAPKGDFVTLAPGHDHALVVLQERAAGDTFTDDFSGYRSSRWLPVAEMESAEAWGYESPQAAAETTNYIEGAQARKIVFPDTNQYYDQWDFGGIALDLAAEERFTDDDYVCLAVYVSRSEIENVAVQFRSGTAGFEYVWATLAAGWNFLYIKRSEFSEVPTAPSWANITALLYYGTLSGSYGVDETLITDYWRIEKADPDNAAIPNATGDVWNFQPAAGVWAITEDVAEDTPGATLAYLYSTAHLGVALLDMDTPDDLRFTARAYAKRDAGSVGVFWRGDETLMLASGHEQGYAALLNAASNNWGLYRYTSGVATGLYTHSTGVSTDKWYTLGVEAKDSTHRLYCALSSGLSYDDSAVFDAAYLRTTVVDATYSSGKIGFLAQGTLGRFDDVVVESLADQHVPADQITVTGQALFRTIAPFD